MNTGVTNETKKGAGRSRHLLSIGSIVLCGLDTRLTFLPLPKQRPHARIFLIFALSLGRIGHATSA
jgi:hypothetical protein